MHTMSFRKIGAFLLVLFACSAFTSSCGLAKKKDKEDEPAGLSGAAAIVGKWNAFYYMSLKENGEPEGEGLPMTLVFEENGNFTWSLTGDTTARARGTWQESLSERLLITVRESNNLSRLPKSSAAMRLKYSLASSALDIVGTNFKIEATKESAGNGSDTTSANTTFANHWSCEQAGITTRLEVATNYIWRATITDRDGRIAVLSGTGHGGEDAGLVLTITSSNHPTQPGGHLVLYLQGTGGYLESVSGNTTEPLGNCTHG